MALFAGRYPARTPIPVENARVESASQTGIMEIDGFQLLSVTGLAVAASIATSVAYPGRILEEKKDVVSKEEILDQIIDEVEKPSEYVPKHRKEGKHAL